jgi:hypothetical protein
MWIFTKHGFFSIVKKKYREQDKPYQIRSRALNDLENLIEKTSLDAEIIETPYADYFFRIIIGDNDLLKIFKVLQEDLDYDNFKSMIAKQDDQKDKLDSYHKIWNVMYNYQNNKT